MNYKKLLENAVRIAQEEEREQWNNHKELRLGMFLDALKGYNNDVIQWYYNDEMHRNINMDVISADGIKINPLTIILEQKYPETDCKFFLEKGFIDLSEPLVKAVSIGNRKIIDMIINANGAYNIDTMSVYKAISIAKSAMYGAKDDIINTLNAKFHLPPFPANYPSLMPFPYTTLVEVIEQYEKCFITEWEHTGIQWVDILKRIRQSKVLQEVITHNMMKYRPPHYKDCITIAKTLYLSKYWKKKYIAMIALLILNYWREEFGAYHSKTGIDVEAHKILAELSS